ncbi:TVP38/TMEM64 family protein [Paenibacillus sp. TRM 82003]|nr:TVP38/TMEM64 family protein [Paenibacillus sp. TRM 82003]
MLSDLLSMTEEGQWILWLEQYRSFGPLPGLLLPFLKSFIPPLPTMIIIGWNAAVYGLWLGFLYSWIGVFAGCLTTFLIIRKLSEHPFMRRWSEKPKVRRGMLWIRRNAFSYVFLLGLFPIGPFVVVNVAAGLARMNVRSYALAVAAGKGIMIFTVSYFGHDPAMYVEHPWRLLYILLLVGVSLFFSKRLEAKFAKEPGYRERVRKDSPSENFNQ